MNQVDNSSLGLEYKILGDGYEVTGIGTCTDTSVIIPSFYNGKPIISIGVEAFSFCENITNIRIGNNIVFINDLAFSNCKQLKNIEISSSVIYIGAFVIMGCDSLKNIKIPYNVKNISHWTFVGCFTLESIEVDNSNMYYDSRENCNSIIETKSNTLIKGCNNSFIPDSIDHIGFLAFECCNSLENITIPDDVITIGKEAFTDCKNLKEINIGNKLNSIKEEAFKNCDKLTTVYYTGTKEQWNAITIEEGNDKLINSNIIYINKW